MPKFKHHLLSSSIQVQKMIEIGIGCQKIQFTQRRTKILKVHALGGMNKHFMPVTGLINLKGPFRIAYADYTSSFEQILEIDDSTNIHQLNLRVLATEKYKVFGSPLFIRELFTVKNGIHIFSNLGRKFFG